MSLYDSTESPPWRGELRCNEPLARHNSWRVGGPAARLYRPTDAEDLAVFLRQLDPREPLEWIGLGSNLLVADAGFAGTLIQTQGCLTGLRCLEDGALHAEAGVASAKAARCAVHHGLSGLEFLAGIPGTIGGALAMNAGAWGAEIWDFVTEVTTIDRYGATHERQPGDFQVGYRSVQGPPGEWFLAVQLHLTTGDPAVGAARIRDLLARRSATQPIGQASCGSVFRNPPGDHAARLIDAAGLKGLQIGGAMVSDQHANFIINRGAASAADIHALIKRVADVVEQTYDIRLIPEVRCIGGEPQ
ncbi:UDP-N-acetylmuramate dehydrogenase [Rhabdochromatium marinum]|uniref:UDP-N-acetylmuramate dehydrogenase n=1 Tax=Rhabdochromatium marinum TaxID=48729 RepID=UPI00190385A2|nr:UDP-N-acetylmuramate dehydrogenase [Rhabdochromatium marinum]MBK1648510.1 UDP-N-acetylenolpyruvoylglucosamine reductase [Rhabdochromatium marinum]